MTAALTVRQFFLIKFNYIGSFMGWMNKDCETFYTLYKFVFLVTSEIEYLL